MRGEKLQVRKAKANITGSSPHARGKVFEIGTFCRHGRIIPACAGKSIGGTKNA